MTPEKREQLARASQEIGGNARVATYLPNGQTEIKWPDGMRYVGGVGGTTGDVPHGRGTYWIDGWKTYEGPVVNGILSGPNGKNFQPSGKVYFGDFVDGAYNGYGRLYDENGRLWYEGEFKDNATHGKGTRYLNSGQKIVGQFAAGYPEGLCTLYGADGNVEYHGLFVKGKPAPHG